MTETFTEPSGRERPLAEKTAIVVGASRGLGRGVATTLAAAGAEVVAVARSEQPLRELAHEASNVRPEPANASQPAAAARLISRYNPDLLVIVAGAAPPILPLLEQTWETLSVNWRADVQIAFHWLQAALREPLAPGSRVVLFSSGAALQGSPLSGGYAGAKATQRFLTAYAAEEARRLDLGLSFTVLMPRITPMTELGRPAVAAYAARQGKTQEEYMAQMGEPVTPQSAGAAVLALLTAETGSLAGAYLLTGSGVKSLD